MASSALDRLPPLATTGVGSLPFDDPAAAVRHAARAYDVPFCPQLPALDGDMVGEWLGGDPRRCGWSPGRDRQRPAGWDAFVELAASRPPVHTSIRQAPGDRAGHARRRARPRRRGSRRRDRAVARGERRGADRAAPRARGRDGPRRRARARGAGPNRDRRLGPPPGHRCCRAGPAYLGRVPWALVDAVDADLLSFDLTRAALEPHARRALRRLLRRGGRVAWGAPDPVDPGHLGRRGRTGRRRAADALAGDGLDLDVVAARSLPSPPRAVPAG